MASEIAPDHEDRIFRDIDEDSNLRTQVGRILTAAGITDDIPWFFQNCRSSRQTALEEEFPTPVVCAWLGNSRETAHKHYLKVRESHFESATRSTGLHEGLQQAAVSGGIGLQQTEGGNKETQGKSNFQRLNNVKNTLGRIRRNPKNKGKSVVPSAGMHWALPVTARAGRRCIRTSLFRGG